MTEAETVQSLKQKLAACEAALESDRKKIKRLNAEALYMKTACARFIPSTAVLHPSSLAASNPNTMVTSHPEIVLEETETTVTISRTAYELLQLKDRAMDSIKEGITIADCSQPDMPLIYANQGFVRITGTQVAEVLGKNCRFLQGDGTEEENVQKLREAVAQGKACHVTLTNYRRNGDAFVNYLSITPVHNPEGRLTHYVGVQSDITELVEHKKAELAAKHQAVQAAAATEAKSQFLARMSHEIRTPLNGMIAVGQLLAEENLTPSQRDLVSTIRHSGETLLILISDILDFSRIEANKLVLALHKFMLRNVVETAVEIAGLSAAQKRLQVAYHIAENVPAVIMGDGQRLQQVLLNVLNNAVKFTECGEVLCEIWLEKSDMGNLSQTGYILDVGLEDGHAGGRNGCSAPSCVQAAHDSDHSQPCTPIKERSQPATPANEEQERRDRAGQDTDSSGGPGSGMSSTPRESTQNSRRSSAALPSHQEGCSGSSNGSISSDGLQSGECTHTACGRKLACHPKKQTLINTIHFTVRDTGIGIGKADLGRLFQQFSQVDPSKHRNHGGSGLGLAICKRLVEAMGGKIWAESEGPEKGSCFHFTIQCPDESQWQKTDSSANRMTSSGSLPGFHLGQQRAVSGAPSLPSQNSQEVCFLSNASSSARLNSSGDPGRYIAEMPNPHTEQPNDLRAVPQQESQDHIAELRQVLTDILPSGSDTASAQSTEVSHRGSMDKHKRPAMEKQHKFPPAYCNGQGRHSQHCGLTAQDSQDTPFKRPSLEAGRELSKCRPPLPSSISLGSSEPDHGLVGKRVLLIEPMRSVRQCLQLYLQRQGMLVEAVSSEDHAISCLKLQGVLTRKGSIERLDDLAEESSCLSLEHEQAADQAHEEVKGPFDVVVSDVCQVHIRNALIQSAPSEAQRLVFMSWPGQKELEDGSDLSEDSNTIFEVGSSPLSQHPSVMPPKAQKEEMQHKMTIRQLGYVTVYRPIRQERLKQALAEVLRMPMDQFSKDANLPMKSSLASSSAGSTFDGALQTASHRQQSMSRDLKTSTRSSSTTSLNSNCLSKRLRVLIAEDNIINLKVALGILQRAGVKDVVCAADGIAAFEEITGRGGGDAFDIILTDLHMPRKGGLELVRDVREAWPRSSTKIVAVTADAFDDTRDMCLQAGFDGWLAKPFRIQDLTRVIDLVLTSKRPHS